MKTCAVCGKPLTGRQRKFCSRKCSNRSLDGKFKVTVKENKCVKCKRVLPASSFGIRSSNRTGLKSMCKECEKQYKAERYKTFKLLCLDYLEHRCSICGYSEHWAALQFHHRNPEEKDFTISEYNRAEIIANNALTEEIMIELDKCVVVCANCHSVIHCGDDRR